MNINFRVAIGVFLLLITGIGGILITAQKEPEVLGEIAPVYYVEDVIDGDTVVVSEGNKIETVKLLGTDSLELDSKRAEEVCFAKVAKGRLTELVMGKEVTLRADGTQNDKDRYGRLLRYVFLADGTFVNKKMIEEGHVYEYKYQAPYKFQAEFDTAQEFARVNELGVWGGSCLTP